MKRSAKGYNGTTAMSRQSPDVTIYFWLYEERSQLVADKFNQIVRLFYPIAFVSVIAVSIFVFEVVSKA